MIEVHENINNPDPNYITLLKELGDVPSDHWAMSIIDTKSVLELGCGNGNLAVPASYIASEYCAVDAVPSLISSIEKRAPQNLDARCADFFQINLGRKYDVVISISCLLNVFDRESALLLLECAGKHVSKKGAVVLEVFDPEKMEGAYDFSGMSISFEALRENVVACTGVYKLGAKYLLKTELKVLYPDDLEEMFEKVGLEIYRIDEADILTKAVYARLA